MPPRLPTSSDFASSVTLSIIPPPQSQKPTNILLLFHGLGDTHLPFTNFARSLSLPETACLSVRAPAPLPFDLGGFHWGDDVLFSEQNEGIEHDAGFAKSTKVLADDVIGALKEKCGYQPREILIFGFGQGGMAALNVAARLDEELGGVVSIGGALPSSVSTPKKKNRTPVIVCHGKRKSAIDEDDVDKLKEVFEFVEIKEWAKTGDGMPANRDEMLPIMQFFATRLRSMKGVPAGSVELT